MKDQSELNSELIELTEAQGRAMTRKEEARSSLMAAKSGQVDALARLNDAELCLLQAEEDGMSTARDQAAADAAQAKCAYEEARKATESVEQEFAEACEELSTCVDRFRSALDSARRRRQAFQSDE